MTIAMMHKPWKKLALIMLINKICGEMTDHMSPAMPPPFNDVDFLFFKKRQPNFLDRLCYYLLLLLYRKNETPYYTIATFLATLLAQIKNSTGIMPEEKV